MRIQEIERITGLDRASIRYYEREGLLAPMRAGNGYREYSNEDADLLKKIKLLRRLGLSVGSVRNLEQGSETLLSVLPELIQNHTDQIEEHRRCRTVCQAIYDDGAAFDSLDAEHYMQLLKDVKVNNNTPVTNHFREAIPPEIHPWKRFLARWLDYALWNGLILFLIVVIIRVRPAPNQFLIAVIGIFSAVSMIPVETCFLHYAGTTPGKWIMGIRLEYIQGGNLPWNEAFERSKQVCVHGLGCGVPLLEQILLYVRYCALTGRSVRRFARYNEIDPPQDMAWDDQTEITYEALNWKRGAALIIGLALIVGLSCTTALDSIKPKYRGNTLTIAQFAENYNVYLDIVQKDTEIYQKLQPTGQKYPMPENVFVIDVGCDEKEFSFEYVMNGDTIETVVLHSEWKGATLLMPLSGEPQNIVFSLLLAQEWSAYGDLAALEALLEQYANEKSAEFQYKNLKISWQIDTDLTMSQGMILSAESNDAPVKMQLSVTVKQD